MLSAGIRNRMKYIRYYKEDAEKAVDRYTDETASLLEDILKELQLDGEVVDENGIKGRLIVRRKKLIDIVFKANSCETAVGWRINNDINKEVKRLTEKFRKA